MSPKDFDALMIALEINGALEALRERGFRPATSCLDVRIETGKVIIPLYWHGRDDIRDALVIYPDEAFAYYGQRAPLFIGYDTAAIASALVCEAELAK